MNATEGKREVRRVAFNETMLPLERALNASLVPMGVEPTRAPTNPIEVPKTEPDYLPIGSSLPGTPTLRTAEAAPNASAGAEAIEAATAAARAATAALQKALNGSWANAPQPAPPEP